MKRSRRAATKKAKTNALKATTTSNIKSLNRNRESHWEIMYQKLKDFQEKHGHCNVPRYHNSKPKLGAWVSTQRSQCYKIEVGKRSNITPERIEKLSRLGFNFKPRGRHNVVWEERFEQLKEYKRQHGNCYVSVSYDEKLSKWSSMQRRYYHLRRLGMKSHITKERVEALESIGFVWDTEGTKRNFGSDWETECTERETKCKLENPPIDESKRKLKTKLKIDNGEESEDFDDVLERETECKLENPPINESKRKLRTKPKIDYGEESEDFDDVSAEEEYGKNRCLPFDVTTSESTQSSSSSHTEPMTSLPMNSDSVELLWQCDVCKTAVFKIYEEAIAHETACGK